MTPLLELIREALALDAAASLHDSDGPGSLDAWDSLAHLRLMSAIEKTYGVALAPEEIAEAVTIADLKALLRRKGVAP